ncbi:hypothetical protein GCM10010399_81460 [Dactylosporangium fulvum]|uniref:Uncharacterized protein n=1 Tax=Dactylosporangium fulvum TaxID=53359 RepID=A0ABY5W893_9ACTN|nr:hypothetical protein [Dactylosporangium fulvum]UWP86303.1 hypothetical protein Dfulv_19515 [Dactylosporangium fulvum]
MTAHDKGVEGVWRDEGRLPLDELMQAVAVSSQEGQGDDVAGNDAGIEEALLAQERERQEWRRRHREGDPDPDSEIGRSLRPDFTGPVGPG